MRKQVDLDDEEEEEEEEEDNDNDDDDDDHDDCYGNAKSHGQTRQGHWTLVELHVHQTLPDTRQAAGEMSDARQKPRYYGRPPVHPDLM